MEIWKELKINKDYYVSNTGLVKRNEKILKPYKHNKGYLAVSINGKTKLIHRLVAETFIPNPDNKPTINHINGGKEDNRVENLEWNTYKENNDHALINNLRKSGNGKIARKIRQYDKQGNLIKEWDNIMQIREKTQYKDYNIFKSCEKVHLTSYGYYWKYL